MGTYSFADEALADLEVIYESMSEISRDFAIRFFDNTSDRFRK